MYHRFRLYGFLKNLRFFDPFLVLFFRDMGFSFLQIGLLYSIRELSTNLLEIPTGVLADSFGRRKAMMTSFSAYILSFALFYAVPRFWAYAMAMVLFAMGETFRSGTHKAMILEYLRMHGWEEYRIAYYGRTRAASQLGSAMAALLAGAMVFYTGNYRIAFLASMIPYALGLILFATYPRSLDGAHDGSARGRLRDAGKVLWATLRELARALRQPALWKGLFSSAGFAGVFRSAKDYLQPILKAQALALPVLLALSLEQRTAILVAVIYCAIYSLTAWAATHACTVSSRFRSLPQATTMTYVVGLLVLAGAGAAAWAHISWAAILGFVLLFVVQNVRRPMLVGYLSELFEHRSMAAGLSVENQLRALVATAVAPLLGLVADSWGVGPALLVVAGCGLLLTPVLVTRETKQTR